MAKTLDELVKAAFGEQMFAILQLQAQLEVLKEQLAKAEAEHVETPPTFPRSLGVSE